ncbi:MAG: hypothetical protein RBT47_03135 [Anaerolineae bacterium]|jgi:hypothetical protein|nr:hypothetical protein [Anaerolineae bacterium]
MSESVIPTVVEQLLMLPDDMQRQVLEFMQTLRVTMRQGTPGKQLVQFTGLIPEEDLVQMRHTIEAEYGLLVPEMPLISATNSSVVE